MVDVSGRISILRYYYLLSPVDLADMGRSHTTSGWVVLVRPSTYILALEIEEDVAVLHVDNICSMVYL